MGKLKQRKLAGSTIVEAIVASLIFLTVFVISLSTVTGFTLREDEGYAVIEAERRLRDCFVRYGDGTWAEGSYTDEFGWGRITTVIAPYGDYERLRMVVMRAVLCNSRKSIEFRRLIICSDE